MDSAYLDRGHVIHFRCKHPEAAGIRLDVMAKMRGCGDFESLWNERTTLQDAEGVVYQLLGIEDLILAKKTQRDKDWPMLSRLVDAHYDQHRWEPTEARVRFWLRESRTPEVLIRLAAEYPEVLKEVCKIRPLLAETLSASRAAVQQGLDEEQAAERESDRQYWRPLIRELETLRMARRRREA